MAVLPPCRSGNSRPVGPEVWSPDSRYILCNYQANGGWNNEDVALIDLETGEITDLTESGYSDGGFRWALKGKAMTWTSDKNGYRSHGSWGADRDVYIMFFDGKAYTDFTKDKEDKDIDKMMAGDKKEKKGKKDTAKVEKKEEKLVLDLDDRRDRTIKLTRFSGRLGDHYLTQDGKKLYYTTRLERSMDLCVLNIEDNSIKVLIKGVMGSFYPSSDDKFIYVHSGTGVSKINTSTGKKESIPFSGEFEYTWWIWRAPVTAPPPTCRWSLISPQTPPLRWRSAAAFAPWKPSRPTWMQG